MPQRRRVAFYAPLKPPDHPQPSGDRAMARLLMAALKEAGYDVSLVSSLRAYLRSPDDAEAHAAIVAAARDERDRIEAVWRADGPPDLWVSYHPYYKSPDLLGLPLCQAHGVPWVTFEASQSIRRSVGVWAETQASALETARGAQVNIAFTARDIEGLHEVDPALPVARLAPFIDAAPFLAVEPAPRPGHLVTVAMMRGGQKLESFRRLAEALANLGDLDWSLTIVGDGPARAEVEALLADLPSARLTWAGQRDPQGVRDVLAQAAAFVGPGSGRLLGWPISRRRPLAFPLSRSAWRAFPRSSPMDKPAS